MLYWTADCGVNITMNNDADAPTIAHPVSTAAASAIGNTAAIGAPM